ncbi:sulfite oxidase-like [Diabrotica virgifera virgifera]|uniref:sulfite oxidase n=1 Tax=Diabrotica virgifera virgifera TaxID=50390 RepID=A0ABM5K7M9_DIAVI|nr:sulfite oxidase-like [Diabrotica virgifera virgifera]
MFSRTFSRTNICRTAYQYFCYSTIGSQKHNFHKDDSSTFKVKNLLIGGLVTGCIGYYFVGNKKVVLAKESPKVDKSDAVPGNYRSNLPVYSLDEIASHNSKETGIWVTYKEGVYNITEFVEGHPGGDQILMAAGSSVEPFWMLYGIHENPHVYEILETYRIGNLKPDDRNYFTSDMSDPYSTDPKRHIALKPACVKPFNAELPPELLVESFLTPNELFYVRNHLPVPEINPDSYELEIDIEGKNKVTVFTLEQLKKMPKHTITATIMCAGNRRSEMIQVRPVKGLNWGAAAIGNATWSGVYLRDVLLLAGMDENDQKYKHVQFEGYDSDATGKTYGASIPIWKALDQRGDVLLAYEMNGVPIPRDHGFPVRVIVPGIVGARNVKWLEKIIVSENESDSHWQQNDYKGFSPSVDWDTVDFTKSPAIQELPVISAICQPTANGAVKVEDGKITVKGYAWSGGGQKIVRVDVTIDGGKTWHVAKFDHQDKTPPPKHWSWTLWSIEIPVDANLKSVEIWAKAVDSSYNTQPENVENIWNLRGVLSNAYHKVRANLKK